MPPYTAFERSAVNQDLAIRFTSEDDTVELILSEPQLCGQNDERLPTEEDVSERVHDFGIFDMIYTNRWDEVKELLLFHEEVASVALPDGHLSRCFPGKAVKGNLVLHEVCKRKPPSEIVNILLGVYPSAAFTKGEWGYLPLHYACEWGASAKVIKTLLMVHPGAMSVKEDYNSMLPIHLACQKAASKGVLEVLVTHFPEGVNERDGLCQLPVGYARAIINANDRKTTVAVLERGAALCATSRATKARMKEIFHQKQKGLKVQHKKTIEGLNASHEENVAKISGDLLDAEFESVQLKEELDEAKAKLTQVQSKFDLQSITLAEKQNQFLKLQEESRLSSIIEDVKHGVEIEKLNEKVTHHQTKVGLLYIELEIKKSMVQTLEKELEIQKEVHNALLRADQQHFQECQKREEKLKKQIEELKASNKYRHCLL